MFLNPKKFKPRGEYHLVRFTDPATQTESGIYLPETSQTNFTECEILASGPGLAIPQDDVYKSTARSYMWGQVGHIVLIEKHSFIPIAGYKEGLVCDSDLIALVRGSDGALFPLNDWVKLEVPQKNEYHGSIAIPEEFQQKRAQGVIRGLGPGKLHKSGKLCGYRTPIYGIMGLDRNSELIGKTAIWDDGATILELGRDWVNCLFIQAFEVSGLLEGDCTK